MKYDAIIFDVSDTLVEYSPNYAKIYGDRLRNLGFIISNDKAKEISRIINWTICEQTRIEQLGEPHITKVELNTLVDKAALSCVMDKEMSKKEYLSILSLLPIPEQKMTIIPGVINVLKVLKEKYRLAIVSNHYSWLKDYLDDIGLTAYFEMVIISEIVGVSKPDIRILQIALDELGLESKQCLYVGDQPYDVLCSKQIGMDCVWINVDNVELPEVISFREDYRINNILELLDIV